MCFNTSRSYATERTDANFPSATVSPCSSLAVLALTWQPTPVLAQAGGDPAPGCSKRCEIRFRCGEVNHDFLSSGECSGLKLELDCADQTTIAAAEEEDEEVLDLSGESKQNLPHHCLFSLIFIALCGSSIVQAGKGDETTAVRWCMSEGLPRD